MELNLLEQTVGKTQPLPVVNVKVGEQVESINLGVNFMGTPMPLAVYRMSPSKVLPMTSLVSSPLPPLKIARVILP